MARGARFVPFARTFITVISWHRPNGPRKFIVYSSIGGPLWAPGMTLLGALLGRIPWVRDNLNTILYLMLAAVMVVSAVPIISGVRKKRGDKRTVEATA